MRILASFSVNFTLNNSLTEINLLIATNTANLITFFFLNADMDPKAQNTVEDLMLRILHLEGIHSSKGVCLYTVDGMPLTDDPFFNSCKFSFVFFSK